MAPTMSKVLPESAIVMKLGEDYLDAGKTSRAEQDNPQVIRCIKAQLWSCITAVHWSDIRFTQMTDVTLIKSIGLLNME